MIILALDPSTTCTGYAVLGDNESLIEAGRLNPAKKKMAYQYRVESMVRGLQKVLDEHNPEICIIEAPEGKVHRRKFASHGLGQSIYGFACGAFWWKCVDYFGIGLVRCVGVNKWTRGIPKKDRALKVSMRFPQYKLEDDKGMDMSDAIGLGLWWIRSSKAKLLEGKK